MSDLFSVGFPVPKPSPQEVAELSTQVAIPKGVMEGIQKGAASTAAQSLRQPMELADQLAGHVLEPANDAIGSAGAIQTAITAGTQQAASDALQAPFVTAMQMGYTPQGSALLPYYQTTLASTRKARARKKIPPPPQSAQPQPQIALPQPIQKPPAGGAPTATGNGPPPPAPIQKPPPTGSSAPGVPPCGYFLNQTPLALQLSNGKGVYYSAGALVGAGQATAENLALLSYFPTLAALQGAAPGAGLVGPDLGDCPSGAPPAPMPPSGAPAPLLPPLGPQGGLVPLSPPLLPPGMPAPLAPPSPPSPPCCPPSPISISIPPCPPNLIYIFTPACPTCGAPGQLAPFPVSGPVLPGAPLSLPPTVNFSIPPCPSCGTPQNNITVNVPVDLAVTLPEVAPGGGVQGTTAASPPSGGLPSPAGPSGACPTCSIAWLALNHPQFVMAERASRKTDYDILVDAISLGLCCAALPLMPTCSMPLLEREVPDFVLAAKAQGLSDDQVIQSAVNIGLCADTSTATGLGEENVGYIAPGSAEQLASEFDPSAAGEAPAGTSAQKTDITSLLNPLLVLTGINRVFGPGAGVDTPMPPPLTSLPQPPAEIVDMLFKSSECLVGLERPLAALADNVKTFVAASCAGATGTPAWALHKVADSLRSSHIPGTGVLACVLDVAVSVVAGGFCDVNTIGQWTTALIGCRYEFNVPLLILEAILGVLNKYTDLIPDEIRDAIDRAKRWNCPTGLPSAADANAMFARGWIDGDVWDCLVRAGGDQKKYQQMVVDAQQTVPSPEEVLTLERKGILQGDDLTAAYRHVGFQDAKQLDYWHQANVWIASPSDAIDWMIKDVADPQIVDTFLTDAEFAQKYQGHVKEVFDWNGIATEDAQNIWRAHWRNMAPHELYQLHKRLRPGWTKRFSDQEALDLAQAICPRRPAVVTDALAAARPVSNGFPVPTYCEEVADAATARRWLESLVTTGYHVSEALGQADFPPFWRQRLLALSYNALNRTDLRSAYVQGSITPERLLSGLEDIGYFEDDAIALQRQDTVQAILRHTKNTVCTQWVNYGGDLSLVQITLMAEGMAVWMWPYVLYILQLRRAGRMLILFVRQIQSQFMRGLLSAAQALAALMKYQHPTVTPPSPLAGFPALASLGLRVAEDELRAMVDFWDQLKQQKPKQETASQICKDFQTGLISGKQAIDLLMQLNYTRSAAMRILSICYLTNVPKTLQKAPAPGTSAYQKMQDALNS